MKAVLWQQPGQSMADVSELFRTIELPVMPDIGLELIASLDDDDVTQGDLAALIARDPALAARLLAMANSAAFGLPRKVATIDAALRLIGLSRVRALALSACLHNAFSLPDALDSEQFWNYCRDCAGYAQWLTDGLAERSAVDRQQAWLAGLMLRLGEVIIGHAMPDALPYMVARPCPPGERWSRQRALARFDEGEVMAELARRWNFPALMVHAMLGAADPLGADTFDPLAGILHLAALLADSRERGEKAIAQLPAEVMDRLELRYGWLVAEFPTLPVLPGLAG